MIVIANYKRYAKAAKLKVSVFKCDAKVRLMFNFAKLPVLLQQFRNLKKNLMLNKG